MKAKTLTIVSIIVYLSLFLSACGPNSSFKVKPDGRPMTNEVILPPGDPNNTEPVTGVDNSLTLQGLYEKCVSELPNKIPESVDNDLFGEDAYIIYCGDPEINGSLAQIDMVLVPALELTRITPTETDDVVVYGIVFLRGVAYIATAIAVGKLSMDTIYLMSNHSNRDHSPNVEGSMARVLIANFITAMANFSNGQDQDPRNKCGVLKDAGGAVMKIAFFVYDKLQNTTAVVWYWAKTPGTPWGGAYQKDENGWTFEQGPTKTSDWTWTVGPDICSQYGEQVPSLQPAQPAH